MHKKIDISDLDIPRDDVECWNRYPKHRWVYDLSRLFDAQGIKWSPFRTETLTDEVQTISLDSEEPIIYSPGKIFYNAPTGRVYVSEIYMTKGEIKSMHHLFRDFGVETELSGAAEIRLLAFMSIHFQKFTGIVSVETVGADIYSIKLRPSHSELAIMADNSTIKLIKRIYKKTELTINGPTDQVLRETLAS